MNYITSYCSISNTGLSVNGSILYTNSEAPTDVFLKGIYKDLKTEYPKFYKMDTLSKLSFMAVEALKQAHPQIANYGDNEIALLFSNKHSSADTDYKFRDSYQLDMAPGPALFVYTLPNILIGELCIRNKWHGENLFIVSPHFDINFIINYCNILMTKNARACLCGWVNVFDETEVFLFFAEQSDSSGLNLELTIDSLTYLYNKTS